MTDTIIMIRPYSFRSNEETIGNNEFQANNPDNFNQLSNLTKLALVEFDNFVNKLKKIGINVFVIQDTADKDTPDSIFPNNWISFHNNDNVEKYFILYPMYSKNRRNERLLLHKIKELNILNDYKMYNNFISYEKNDQFLEGTGSIVLDRANRYAFCSLSIRSNKTLVKKWCEYTDYTAVFFTSFNNNQEIYHTNVVMSICDTFAIICTEAIMNPDEKENVINILKKLGKEIIIITKDQMNNFAGNVLQLIKKRSKEVLNNVNKSF